MLQRVDGFSGQARNVLNVAAAMGSSFEFAHIVEVISRLNTNYGTGKHQIFENAKGGAKIVLDQAVQEGILYFEYHSSAAFNSWEPQDNLSRCPEFGSVEELTFTFTHEAWRATILKLMLGSLKRTIHRAIALTLEAALDDTMHDYLSHLKLFCHWKGSGDFPKAVSVALDVGKMFEDLGLSQQCIRLYRDTLEMWNTGGSPSESITWLSRNVLAIATSAEVNSFIKLFVAMGKAFLNLHRTRDSVEVYQNALMVSAPEQTAAK